MRVIAYIDGFNFYYGLTKNTAYRWCDLRALCEKLVPNDIVKDVKLFTANSKALTDPRQPERQNTYFRALEIYSGVLITRSSFSVQKKEFYRSDGFGKINVNVPYEKGADVNLATSLLVDAYLKNFDLALILSNDSDLEQPILNVRKVFRLKVKIFSPIKTSKQRMSDKLIKAAGQGNHDLVPFDLLATCQLPIEIPNKHGKLLKKPKEWS